MKKTRNNLNSDRLYETAASIAALTLTNAFIFQEQLSQENSQVEPLNSLLDKTDFKSAVIDHWQLICREINYVPIFNIARQILLKIPTSADANRKLREVAGNALIIVTERTALRHDLMGRIYHRLLLEAKFLGTFYTSVAAAMLLTKLSLQPGKWNLKWSDIESIKNFHIGDLACGTGTLLMAASQGISDNYVRAMVAQRKKVFPQDLRILHQALMEDILHGYDVLASAVHLTASTLAMLAPGIAFKKMQLFVLPLGQANGKAMLGSIDYLQSDTIATQLNLLEGEASIEPVQVTGEGARVTTAPLPPLDLAIMNPPFVRSVGGNLLFGSIPNRKTLQADLSRRLKSANAQASSTAGLGSVFVAVADRHLKPGGRLAFVLPAAMCAGIAWQKTRGLIASKYVLEYVVTSHDPDKWAFSENTDLSEVLLIARKKVISVKDKEPKTTFVNLWRNPTAGADALALGEAILRSSPPLIEDRVKICHGVESIQVGNRKFGEVAAFAWEQISKSIWAGGAFAQTILARSAWFLLRGKLLLPGNDQVKQIPTCKLSELGTLGPDRRDINDGFVLTTLKTPYPAFWGHTAEDTRTIQLQTNAYLEPRTKNAHGRPLRKISMLLPKAGRLMLAERMWLSTQSMFCVRLNGKALSNVWWPFTLIKDSESHEKALVLWLNSSLGLLIVIFSRVPTRGPWVQFKKPSLMDLPTLNVSKLSKKQLTQFSKLYDEVSDQDIGPMPTIGTDPVRNRIDEGIASILGLPSFASLSHLLAVEPVVCGKPLPTLLVSEKEAKRPSPQFLLPWFPD
jgi:hypothetical protein